MEQQVNDKQECFTMVPNYVFEAILRMNLTGLEHTVVWSHIRHTYGWHKTVDTWSVSQIAKMTNRLPRSIKKAMQNLVAKGVLQIERQGRSSAKCLIVNGVPEDTKLVLKKTPIPVTTRASLGMSSGALSKERKKRQKKAKEFFNSCNNKGENNDNNRQCTTA